MKINRIINNKPMAVAIILLIIIIALSGCTQENGKNVTHLGVGTGVWKKILWDFFYRLFSNTQKSLAQQSLDIIYTQYGICSKVLNISKDKLFPCSIVFCKGYNDLYILRCKWFAYVDGLLCWPIISEKSMNFENPMNEWLLYHMLPY